MHSYYQLGNLESGEIQIRTAWLIIILGKNAFFSIVGKYFYDYRYGITHLGCCFENEDIKVGLRIPRMPMISMK